MSFFGSMNISATGLTAQQVKLDTISQNLANVSTTRTAEGGAYRKKTVVFETLLKEGMTTSEPAGVRVAAIVEDESPLELVYNPSHVDANEEGYVEMPNVNTVTEMVDMISASRAYEANITAFNAMKSMASKALEIGR